MNRIDEDDSANDEMYDSIYQFKKWIIQADEKRTDVVMEDPSPLSAISLEELDVVGTVFRVQRKLLNMLRSNARRFEIAADRLEDILANVNNIPGNTVAIDIKKEDASDIAVNGSVSSHAIMLGLDNLAKLSGFIINDYRNMLLEGFGNLAEVISDEVSAGTIKISSTEISRLVMGRVNDMMIGGLDGAIFGTANQKPLPGNHVIKRAFDRSESLSEKASHLLARPAVPYVAMSHIVKIDTLPDVGAATLKLSKNDIRNMAQKISMILKHAQIPEERYILDRQALLRSLNSIKGFIQEVDDEGKETKMAAWLKRAQSKSMTSFVVASSAKFPAEVFKLASTSLYDLTDVLSKAVHPAQSTEESSDE